MTTNGTSWLYEALKEPEARRVFEEERLVLIATNAIIEAMQKQTITRAQLADRLGTSRAHITQLLSGSRNMTLRTLADITWALGKRVGVQLEALDLADYCILDVPDPTLSAREIPVDDLIDDWEESNYATGEFRAMSELGMVA